MVCTPTMASGASRFIKSTAIFVLCTPNHTVPVKVSPALRNNTCRPFPSPAALLALLTTCATLAKPPTHFPVPGWLHVPEFLLVSSNLACMSLVCKIKRSKFSALACHQNEEDDNNNKHKVRRKHHIVVNLLLFFVGRDCGARLGVVRACVVRRARYWLTMQIQHWSVVLPAGLTVATARLVLRKADRNW